MKQLLNSLDISPKLTGYGYLLLAAEIFEAQGLRGPALIDAISQRTGKRYHWVRIGLQHICRRVNRQDPERFPIQGMSFFLDHMLSLAGAEFFL